MVAPEYADIWRVRGKLMRYNFRGPMCGEGVLGRHYWLLVWVWLSGFLCGLSFIEQEYGGPFVEVGFCGLPIYYVFCFYCFVFCTEVGGNAKLGVWVAGGEDVVEQMAVAVWGFYKNLCLVESGRLFFNRFYFFGSLLAGNGQVSPKGKTLTIHPRSHQCQKNRRGACQRFHTNAVLMG